MRIRSWGMIFATAAGLALSTSRVDAGFTLLDDFNRADAASLGAGWTSRFDGLGVANQQASVDPLYRMTYPLSTYDGVASASVQVDVFSNGDTVQYAALVLGYSTLSENVFIKVQNNGRSTDGFDSVAFYFGDNGVDNGGANIAFLALDSSFRSGRIRATLEGNTATLRIDPGFTGAFTQSYSVTFADYYISRLGTGVGIAAYGAATLDDFGTVAVPEPGSLLMGAVAGFAGLAGWSARRTTRKSA